MRLLMLDAGAGLDPFYEHVLLPAFPPSEMVTLDELRRGVRAGGTEAWAVFDDGDRLVGGAVGDLSPSSRVVLLSYLAVVDGARGGGTGSYLYNEVIRRWAARHRPCVILAEVEHPDRHAGSAAYGDPGARLRFYGRQGGRILELPYFQPSLGGAGRPRVFGMLLLALHADPELWGEGGDETVAAGPLRAFLVEYFVGAEGAMPEDPAGVALWRALDVPGGVPTRPVEQLRGIPVATPGPVPPREVVDRPEGRREPDAAQGMI